MDYSGQKASRNRQGSSPSPPARTQPRRRSRSRSTSASPIRQKTRGKIDDNGPNRTESNVQHEPTRTLFVGNLERDVRESKLREVFGRYGTIEEGMKIYFD
jgi:RNA recognition motif-containing protein